MRLHVWVALRGPGNTIKTFMPGSVSILYYYKPMLNIIAHPGVGTWLFFLNYLLYVMLQGECGNDKANFKKTGKEYANC